MLKTRYKPTRHTQRFTTTPNPSFYSSTKWINLRNSIREKQPLCIYCLYQGIICDDDIEIDHIIPRSIDIELELDPRNLQPLCKSCHSKKSMAEKMGIIDEATKLIHNINYIGDVGDIFNREDDWIEKFEDIQ